MTDNKKLLAIVELGGYPNFTPLYQRNGYEVTMAHAMRKAINMVKKIHPDVIVAEFNYQSNFRDRTSSLESLLATVERLSQGASTQSQGKAIKVIVFYEKEYTPQLEKLQAAFNNFDTLAYPIQEQDLEQALK
ncbi:MAG: hypothetical protein LJE85_09960 [Gammaproteobacteria bacterium]|jgi:hypothetical protein|nr:hypothetical protein [Gammaproteobacteria bacterium]